MISYLPGNLDALDVELGVDACLKIGPLTECGSKITDKLPVWVLKHTFNFSDACKQL